MERQAGIGAAETAHLGSVGSETAGPRSVAPSVAWVRSGVQSWRVSYIRGKTDGKLDRAQSASWEPLSSTTYQVTAHLRIYKTPEPQASYPNSVSRVRQSSTNVTDPTDVDAATQRSLSSLSRTSRVCIVSNPFSFTPGMPF